LIVHVFEFSIYLLFRILQVIFIFCFHFLYLSFLSSPSFALLFPFTLPLPITPLDLYPNSPVPPPNSDLTSFLSPQDIPSGISSSSLGNKKDSSYTNFLLDLLGVVGAGIRRVVLDAEKVRMHVLT
jgi:hypothetical protein